MPDQPLLFSPPPPGATVSPLPAGLTLKAAIIAWGDYLLKQDLSPHTLKAFGGDLDQLAQHVGGEQRVTRLATADLHAWLSHIKTVKHSSPKTYARKITSLKAFFRWLTQTGAVPADPAAPILQQSVLSPLPEILTDAEVQAALAAAESLRHGAKPDPRPYVLFTLLLQTGIKKGECLALVPNHIDLSRPGEPCLWVRYPNPKHRLKERQLKLDPAWIPAYRSYLAQFQPRERLFPWTGRRLEYLLADIGRLAGLEKHLSFDMCRWTCAVREARAGTDFDLIRQKLGLSRIQWREIGVKLQKLAEPAK